MKRIRLNCCDSERYDRGPYGHRWNRKHFLSSQRKGEDRQRLKRANSVVSEGWTWVEYFCWAWLLFYTLSRWTPSSCVNLISILFIIIVPKDIIFFPCIRTVGSKLKTYLYRSYFCFWPTKRTSIDHTCWY